MLEKKVAFSSGNLELEGILSFRDGVSELPGVVFCHPHPLYGGDMENNVVRAVNSWIYEEGFLGLRFNFRGVGKSQGSYGEGIGEKEDVKAALNFLATLEKIDRERIYLVGYSFGAKVGLPVAVEDKRVKGWVGISPALINENEETAYLKKCPKPKLIVYGDRDFVCPQDFMEELFRDLKEPKKGKIIPGADHFYFGLEKNLASEVGNFLRQINSTKSLL